MPRGEKTPGARQDRHEGWGKHIYAVKFRFDDEYHVLSRQELDSIHAASLEILRDVGVHIPNARVLEMAAGEGGDVDQAAQIVRFPPDVIEGHLERRREGARRVRREAGRYRGVLSDAGAGEPAQPHQVKGDVGGLCTMAWDMDLERTRPATCEDLRAGTRIANHLECVRRYTPMFTPSDVPEGTNDLHVWALAFLNSSKDPTGGYILRRSSVAPLHDMAVAYAGSEAEVRRRGLFGYLCFLASPLRFQADALEIALEVHDLGYPVHVGMPMVVAGATGPQTLAGTLTLGNAETLAGWVLSSAFNTETDYGAAAVTMDPATGVACYADPRRTLLAAAALDFARYYGLPMAGAHLSHTDAAAPGMQAGAERVMGALVNVLLGIAPTSIRIGILGPSGMTGCLPQMFIDGEICSMLNALFRGIEVDEERIALDLIKRVGIGGTFLDQEHTAAHLRSELWFPTLFLREHFNEGGEQVLERAKARVREVLAEPEPHPLPEHKEREIRRILERAIGAAG